MKQLLEKNCHFSCEVHEGRLPQLLDFAHFIRRTPITGVLSKRNARWALDYHFEDAGEYRVEGDPGAWKKREKHAVHLYAPGTRYWERSTRKDLPFPETYIVFLAHGISDLDRLVSEGNGFAKVLDTAGVLEDMFINLLDLGAHEIWKAQSIFYRILHHLAAAGKTADPEYEIASTARPDVSLADSVDAYMRAHYDEGITIDRIAEEIGVSRSTLTHIYRKETGTTPFSRLTEYRLDVARGMLLRGERHKTIAEHTGFFDEYHFSKVFKKRYGVAPSRYRPSVSEP